MCKLEDQGQGWRQEIELTIKVWTRERLDDSETEKEIAGRYPAFFNDVLIEQWDNDWSTTQYDGTYLLCC